jgi:hypothetical protein
LEGSRIGSIPVVDISTTPAKLRDGRRIGIDSQEGEAVLLQHIADDLPDPAVPLGFALDVAVQRAQTACKQDQPLSPRLKIHFGFC